MLKIFVKSQNLVLFLSQLFADVVWHPAPSRHMRFKSRGALVPVLPPSELSLSYSEENSRTLSVDFNSEENYYSLKADQGQTSLSMALSTPHQGFRYVFAFFLIWQGNPHGHHFLGKGATSFSFLCLFHLPTSIQHFAGPRRPQDTTTPGPLPSSCRPRLF